MKVSYRIVEEVTPRGEWETVGVIALWHDDPPVLFYKKQGAQSAFMEVMPAPAGPYNVRLKRVMALGGDPSPLATRELVAFLADENSNIRWLAGSSLVQRVGTGEDGGVDAGADTVAAIAAFLDQAGGVTGSGSHRRDG